MDYDEYYQNLMNEIDSEAKPGPRDFTKKKKMGADGTCPRCGLRTYEEVCPACGTNLGLNKDDDDEEDEYYERRRERR